MCVVEQKDRYVKVKLLNPNTLAGVPYLLTPKITTSYLREYVHMHRPRVQIPQDLTHKVFYGIRSFFIHPNIADLPPHFSPYSVKTKWLAEGNLLFNIYA